MKYYNGARRIYPWRRMHRSRAPSIAPGIFFVAQSWAGCITNMPGFSLRQAQAILKAPFDRPALTFYTKADGGYHPPSAQTNGAGMRSQRYSLSPQVVTAVSMSEQWWVDNVRPQLPL